ncbi:hypothetical protein PG993_010362 [Apiospora rasikravindrae]|uniref:Uncharacterized protein n=1 Tax=Apiospora rasikravindrae TaxID=990691 RepID=A0ABR1SM44_9PEZI
MPGRAGPRRVGLPRRARSTSNMIESTLSREALRDIARDAVVERDNLRALADFFRTTIPPSETRNSLSADEECTVFCGADGRKLLWSGQSLRGRVKRSRSQHSQSASAHLPNGVTLQTTADGNPYALISLPISIEGSGPWFQAPETIFGAPTQITTQNTTPPAAGPNGNEAWPERISSRGTMSPTTPLPAIPSRRSSTAGRKMPRSTSKPERAQQQQQHLPIHGARPLESVTFVINKHDGSEPLGSGSTSASEPSEQIIRAVKVLEPPVQTAQAWLLGSEVSGADPTSASSPVNGTEECGNAPGSSSSPAREWPMPSPASPLPPTPTTSLQHRRQMSKAFSLGGAGSPTSTTSPCKSPRALANIAVQSGLQVPQANILPDSPGFAKMLASTTFPSPPSSSRPSIARSNSTGTITSSPSPPGSPPTIRPRTSSKALATSTNGRYATSNKQLSSSPAASSAVLLPTASLNEIVMRPDCHDGLQHAPASNSTARLDQHNVVMTDQGQPQMPPTSNQTNSLLSSAAAQLARRESMGSTSILVDAFGRPESAASFATARERPDSVYSIYDGAAAADSQRVSKASDLTITTDSYQQSLANSRASQQSARSDTTSTTIDSTNANDDYGRHIASSRTSLDIDDLLEEARLSPAKVPPQIQRANFTQGAAALEGSAPVRQAATNVRRPDSRNAVEESNGQQSLIERRMARRTARKIWALDTNHGEDNGGLAPAPSGEQAFRRRISQSVDSPVLGWFPGGNGSGGGALRSHMRSSVSGPSPLANETLTSLPSPPNESDERRCSTYSTSSAPSTQGGCSRAFSASANPSRPLRHQLSISSTMVMETIPDDIPKSPTSTISSEHLTISPIFVVANLEPGTGAITPSRPRPLSQMFLEKANYDLNHRSPLAKVKAKPRQRPLSVRIARNSLTGLLERTESPAVPVDHTMSRMPTPPETPEPFLNRRLSAMRPLPVRLPTPEPTPLSKHSDADDSSSSSEEEEERPDPTQRLANIKERLRKEKQQKEEEIASMIARTVVTVPRTQEEDDTSFEDEPIINVSCEGDPTDTPSQDDPTNGSSDDEAVGVSRDVTTPATPEPEQRIETLSRKGDAWTGVMGPLMKNMSRMLLEMQGDGMCVGLTMREFSDDMEAEAKRISIIQAASTRVGTTPDSTTNTKTTPDTTATTTTGTPTKTNVDCTFDGFDGIQPAAEKIASKPAANDKHPRKGRSESNIARLRLDMDGSVKKPEGMEGSEDAERDTKSEMDKPTVSDVSVPSTPCTPPKLGEDALMSISRRMQAQEALMDTLMNRWGTPNSRYKSRNESSLSDYDSSRPSMASERNSSGGESSASGLGVTLERAFPRASTTDLTTPTQDEHKPPTGKRHLRNKQSGMDMVDSLMGELRSSSTMSNRI